MIKRRDIPNPKISDNELDIDIKEVEGEFEVVFDTTKPFWERFKAFVRGENKAGRTVGMVLDGLFHFVLPRIPVLNLIAPEIKTARKLAQHLLTKKQKTMIKDKPWYQSKTIWSAILILITGLLQALGVDVSGNPELMQTVYEVVYLLAGTLGIVGLRAAIGEKIKE